MKSLIFFLIIVYAAGCASKDKKGPESNRDAYTSISLIYTKKLDEIWATKIHDDPNFTKDYDSCRNEFEIAKWIEKHLSEEIEWCVNQLRNEWRQHLISKSLTFATDSNLMRQALDNVEVNFRRDLLRIYVMRHEFYVQEGLITPR